MNWEGKSYQSITESGLLDDDQDRNGTGIEEETPHGLLHTLVDDNDVSHKLVGVHTACSFFIGTFFVGFLDYWLWFQGWIIGF